MTDTEEPTTPKCDGGPIFLTLDKTETRYIPSPLLSHHSLRNFLDDKDDDAQSPVSRAHYITSHYITQSQWPDTVALTKVIRLIQWH